MIEEKNDLIGQNVNLTGYFTVTKRKLNYNSIANDEDKKAEKESDLTEADRALLKVLMCICIVI